MFATGLPTVDAQDDFRRARRSAIAAGLARRLTRRSATLPSLSGAPSGTPRREVVPIDCIVGTLEPSNGFDARFRPASNLVRSRWERVALAHRTGTALPPVSLVRRPEGHYVVDGRHRVSVARALGHREIDAWVRA